MPLIWFNSIVIWFILLLVLVDLFYYSEERNRERDIIIVEKFIEFKW